MPSGDNAVGNLLLSHLWPEGRRISPRPRAYAS
jgi:hypothetical protein